MKKNISILGAGLVGSLLAVLLKQKGYQVQLFERRPDMRKHAISAGKSINLAMSVRGWQALEKAGLKHIFTELAIPMFGREIHQSNGEINFQAYGKNNEAIYSISRAELNKKLMTHAEQLGVELNFNHQCIHVDLENNNCIFKVEDTEIQHQAEILVGADGAFSALRNEYLKVDKFSYSQYYVDYGYKELYIPPASDGSHLIKSNALHIWPRKNFMIIALPNIDGSFTVTLFLPFKGAVSFENLNNTLDLKQFFENNFPDAIPIMPTLIEDFFENPTSSLVTVKSSPWHYKNKSFLIGDAAHAVVPFYGQGMNAGFEDCRILMEIMEEENENWDSILEKYSTSRVQNGHAIADLALQNFIEMRDLVANEEFLRRKKLEKEIGRMYPSRFNSVYEMISFSNTPYAFALQSQPFQDKLMQNILADPMFQDGVQENESSIIDKYLKNYEEEIKSIVL